MKNSPEVSPILFQKHFKYNTTETKEAGQENQNLEKDLGMPLKKCLFL